MSEKSQLEKSANNKRIAKNTMLLYIRMLITLLVSLYTSRVLLKGLGVDDYGIYNIIGGVVVLFSFLSNAMTNSTQRYLNYNVGLNDELSTKKVFCVSMQAHFVISIVVLILSETIGLWFVNTQLNIPYGRMYAANWVYQLSVFITIIGIMRIPYNAVVIAYEKMSFFAYMSIVETLLKLLIVYLLFIDGGLDRLIFYSILLTQTSVIIWFVYRYYCRKKYKISKYSNIRSRVLFKELMSFTSWYLFGGLAMVGSRQGVNIILNIFFNVAVNAAVGIANQVKSAIYGFVTSFQTAFNPQIVKLYAKKDTESLLPLIYRSTKFSYYLLLILSLPVIFCSKDILSLWLVEVPPYAVIFTQLTIIATIFDAISAPLWTLIGATGKIKKYQIIVSLIIFIDIPVSLALLKLGYEPQWVYLSNIVINASAYLYRVIYARNHINLSLTNYFKNVVISCSLVTISSIVLYFVVYYSTNNVWGVNFALSAILNVICVLILGLDRSERNYLLNFITSKMNK